MATPIPRPVLYALSALLASQLALTVVSVWVSSNNTRKAVQQWCSTLQVFRETYAESPPTTAAGIKIRDGLNGVYVAYRCDQVL